jgi:polar amino acid transport system permease protein
VLLPQAGRQAVPSWVNTATEIVKASTLLSVIGVAELLLATQEIIARTYMSLPFYFFAGLLYFAINFGIERVGKAVERRLALKA